MANYKWIKVNALKKGLTLKDVSERSKFSYGAFIQIINGFRKAPEGFEKYMKDIFNAIDDSTA